jgi:hypothetical protein
MEFVPGKAFPGSHKLYFHCFDPRRSTSMREYSNTINAFTNIICCSTIIQYFVASYQQYQVHNSDYACLWTAVFTNYIFSCPCTSRLAERYCIQRTLIWHFVNYSNAIIIATYRIFEIKALDVFHFYLFIISRVWIDNNTDLRLKNFSEILALLHVFCVLKYKMTLTVAYHVPFFHKIKFS